MRAAPSSPVSRRPCVACKAKPGDVLTPVGEGVARLCWTCAHQVTEHELAVADAALARCSCDATEIEPADPEGSASAAGFNDVLAAHLPYLRAVAMRLTKNAADADDVVQEAIARAFTRWAGFTETRPGAVKGWLATIVRRCFVDEYRKRASRPATSYEPRELDNHASDGHEAWGEYLDAQREIDRLNADQRAVLEMAMAGEPYAEIARHLGIPIGTVMSRLYRARRVLEAALQVSGRVES